MPFSSASPFVVRAIAGLLLATGVALAARRAGSLSSSGALAAIVVGTAAVCAGWSWGALLLVYFITSSALSRLGRATKERRTGAVVAKGGTRDAKQVFANGGVFAAAVLATTASGPLSSIAALAALGALAAATADTWATEIGTLVGGTPRSIITFDRATPGTSGAVSVAGLIAMIAGALFIACVAMALGITGAVAVVALAGTAGALGDSLLGGTLQERRWCATCATHTERRVHDCGSPTTIAAGREWIDNDVVNLFATVAGALVAALLHRG